MLNQLTRLHKEEAGQDLIEYVLIGVIIALGALAGMGTMASSLSTYYTKIAGYIT